MKKNIERDIIHIKNFKLLSSCVVNSKSFAHTHREDVIYEIMYAHVHFVKYTLKIVHNNMRGSSITLKEVKM